MSKPKYSARSYKRLSSCHPRLRALFTTVLEGYDHTILCGNRGEKDQMKAYNEGNSKLKYPKSKHNANPAMAVDVAPYPIDWNNIKRFYHFGGYVQGIAKTMGIKIRWGGDWSGKRTFKQKFNDLPHFEVILEEE